MENPLLDSKFPDVSSKGRGYQLSTYQDGVPGWPQLRKVSIWQTVEALEQEFRERASQIASVKASIGEDAARAFGAASNAADDEFNLAEAKQFTDPVKSNPNVVSAEPTAMKPDDRLAGDKGSELVRSSTLPAKEEKIHASLSSESADGTVDLPDDTIISGLM